MISQTAEYALRAAVVLAEYHGQCLTTHRIAEVAGIPSDYLSKVLQLMNRAGLVQAQRGLHGGFRLLRDPQELTLLDIVGAVEQLPRYTRCPLGRPEHESTLCRLHQRLDRAMAEVEQTLARTRVTEVIPAFSDAETPPATGPTPGTPGTPGGPACRGTSENAGNPGATERTTSR